MWVVHCSNLGLLCPVLSPYDILQSWCVLLQSCHVLMMQPYSVSGTQGHLMTVSRIALTRLWCLGKFLSDIWAVLVCSTSFKGFSWPECVCVLPIFMVIIRCQAVVLESSRVSYGSLAVSFYCHRVSRGCLSIVLWSFVLLSWGILYHP